MSLALTEKSGSQEIAEAVRRSIVGGGFAPNSQLPSIGSLAREHGTTAITVRRALTLLERQGLVRVVHGVGTFVADYGAQLETVLPSFNAEVAARQLSAETVLLERTATAACSAAAQALALPEDMALARLTRLRRVGGRPLAVQHSYLAPRFSGVVERFSPTHSLYRELAVESGRSPFSASEALEVVSLPERIATHLEVAAGSPGWRSLRTTFDASGEPLVFDEAFFPADRLRLRVDRRAGASRVDFDFQFPSAPAAGQEE